MASHIKGHFQRFSNAAIHEEKYFNRARWPHQIFARRTPINFPQRDNFGEWPAVLGQRELFAAVNHRADNLCRVSPQLSQGCFHASHNV